MTPKRDEELLAGGSIYWVIKGEIAAREKLIAIEPFRDKDGIGRCRLVMQPKVIAVSPRPMRAFQAAGLRLVTLRQETTGLLVQKIKGAVAEQFRPPPDFKSSRDI
jgi:hypothetical protein